MPLSWWPLDDMNSSPFFPHRWIFPPNVNKSMLVHPLQVTWRTETVASKEGKKKRRMERREERRRERFEKIVSCYCQMMPVTHRLLAFLHLQSCVLTIVTPPGENKLDLLQDFILLTHCKLLLTLLVASRCNFLFLICKSINWHSPSSTSETQ